MLAEYQLHGTAVGFWNPGTSAMSLNNNEGCVAVTGVALCAVEVAVNTGIMHDIRRLAIISRPNAFDLDLPDGLIAMVLLWF